MLAVLIRRRDRLTRAIADQRRRIMDLAARIDPGGGERRAA